MFVCQKSPPNVCTNERCERSCATPSDLSRHSFPRRHSVGALGLKESREKKRPRYFMYTDLGSEPIFITLPIYFEHRASVLQACGNLSKGRSAAAAAAAYLHHKRCQMQRLAVGHKQVDYYTLTYDFGLFKFSHFHSLHLHSCGYPVFTYVIKVEPRTGSVRQFNVLKFAPELTSQEKQIVQYMWELHRGDAAAHATAWDVFTVTCICRNDLLISLGGGPEGLWFLLSGFLTQCYAQS